MDVQQPGEGIPIASVPNLRDLGGWPTGDGGRVRRGLLYRSTALDRLADEDAEAFRRLGIRRVYDLRTGAEQALRPDRLPPGAEHVAVDVLASMSDAATFDLVTVLNDPSSAGEVFGGDGFGGFFQQSYRDLVSLPSARAGFGRMLTDLSEPGCRPALFHCATGKDRTGWAAAILLMLLGVSDEDVVRDYLLTNDQLLPALDTFLDRFATSAGDAELMRPFFGVHEHYLQTALDEMHRRFGTLGRYLDEGLGVGPEVQDALRLALIETDGP